MPSFSWRRIFKRNNKVFPAEMYQKTVNTTEELPVEEKPPQKTSGKCWLMRKLIKCFSRKKKTPEQKKNDASASSTESDSPVTMAKKEYTAHNNEAETFTFSLSSSCSDSSVSTMVEEEHKAHNEEAEISTPSLVPTCSGNPVSVVEKEDKVHNDEAETSTHSLSLTRYQQLINRGLQNFGSSCYVNASLQCLFSAELFCMQLQWTLNQWMHNPLDSLAGCFAKLWEIRESDYWHLKYALLENLIQEAAVTNPEFTPYQQNDAHQFMFHCLGQMQQILSCAGGVPSECPIKGNFGFQLTCIITCKGCGAEKSRLEEYNHLSLAVVADGSVEDCLEFFFRDEEELECKCEVCSCSSASCRRMFHTLPRYLVLQLKRFELAADFSLTKNLNKVKINPKFHLRLSGQSEHSENEHTLMDAVFTPKEDRKAEEATGRHEVGEFATYSLISVLNHFGSTINSGHYICDSFSYTDNLWLSYDDDKVTGIMKSGVLYDGQTSAYVLMYELM